MPHLSYADAMEQAYPSWDPKKHPRGRDGKFLEVGAFVQVFSGPDGPQIASGKVTASYFAPDGRIFIGVDEGDGTVGWYRPKQIQTADVKALYDYAPAAKHVDSGELPSWPIPAVPEKYDHIAWDKPGTSYDLGNTPQSVKGLLVSGNTEPTPATQAEAKAEQAPPMLAWEPPGGDWAGWLGGIGVDPQYAEAWTDGDGNLLIHDGANGQLTRYSTSKGYPSLLDAQPVGAAGIQAVTSDPQYTQVYETPGMGQGSGPTGAEYEQFPHDQAVKPAVLTPEQNDVWAAALAALYNSPAFVGAKLNYDNVEVYATDANNPGKMWYLREGDSSNAMRVVGGNVETMVSFDSLDGGLIDGHIKKLNVQPPAASALTPSASAKPDGWMDAEGIMHQLPSNVAEAVQPGDKVYTSGSSLVSFAVYKPGGNGQIYTFDGHITAAPKENELSGVWYELQPHYNQTYSVVPPPEMGQAIAYSGVSPDAAAVHYFPGDGSWAVYDTDSGVAIGAWDSQGHSDVPLPYGAVQGQDVAWPLMYPTSDAPGAAWTNEPAIATPGTASIPDALASKAELWHNPNTGNWIAPVPGTDGVELYKADGTYVGALPDGQSTLHDPVSSYVPVKGPDAAAAAGGYQLTGQVAQLDKDTHQFYTAPDKGWVVVNSAGQAFKYSAAGKYQTNLGAMTDISAIIDSAGYIKMVPSAQNPSIMVEEGADEEQAASPVSEPPAAGPAYTPIKLPKGKTAADMLYMIGTSYANKNEGDPDAIADFQLKLHAVTQAQSYEVALPQLNKLMTEAKLGGKQRARYKTLLMMHFGHNPDPGESEKSAVTGDPGAWRKVSPSKVGLPSVTGAVKGNQLVQSGGPHAGAAKANIQRELAKRLRGRVSAEQVLASYTDTAYTHNPSSVEFAERAKEYLGQGGPAPAGIRLERNSIGNWMFTHGPGGSPALTSEQILDALHENLVNQLVQLWAQTSNDNNPRSLAMQRAAEDEFGLKGTHEWLQMKAETEQEYGKHGALFREFLRSMYEHTQEWGKANGVSHVRLVRGMNNTANPGAAVGQEHDLKLRPMSSFTSNVGTANNFGAHYVVEAYVPIEWIIGTAATGFGCRNEYEWVILGGVHRVRRYK